MKTVTAMLAVAASCALPGSAAAQTGAPAPIHWTAQTERLGAVAARPPGPESLGAATTEAGHFRVSLASELVPVPINRMHAWVVTVVTRDGVPVSDARLDVAGGMPENGRSLPTAPRVTRALGGGRYLIEGMKFNMSGHWRLTLALHAGRLRDRVAVDVVAR